MALKLETKLFFFLFTASFIPIALFFFLMFGQVQTKAQDVSLATLDVVAHNAASKVELFVLTHSRELLTASQGTVVRNPSNLTMTLGRMRLLQQTSLFDDVTLIRNDGIVLASTSYAYRGEWSTQSWFLLAQSGSAAISDAHVILDPYRLVIVYAAPVYRDDGKEIGVLASQLNLISLQNITDSVYAGDTGFAYILNSQNRFVTYPDESKLFTLSPNEPVPCVSGHRTIKLPDGSSVIESYVPILSKEIYDGNGCWQLVVRQDEREVFSTVNTARNEAIAVLFAVLIFIFFVGRYISRKISLPLVNLRDAFRAVSEGKYGTRVDIDTGDELEDLANAFNQTTAALAEVSDEHKQIDEAKTQFLSMTSHELRSPMTPMKAQLQMLEEGYFGSLTKKQRDSIDIILRNADHLDSILSDLLEVSRIEAARLKFNFVKSNLFDPIKRLVSEMKGFMPEKHIVIETKLGKIPVIDVDPDRVMQILRNLVNNAIKFSDPNTKIIISATPSQKEILFSVHNTGVVIASENKRNIFEPFFQEENVLQRKHGGSGLGLTICRGIVESQGGKMWYESTKEKGTTFYFTLPLVPVKDIKPIKMLFTSKTFLDKKIRDIFIQNLGPVADSEFDTLAQFGIQYKLLSDYLAALRTQGVIDEKTYEKMKTEISVAIGIDESEDTDELVRRLLIELLGPLGTKEFKKLKQPLTEDAVLSRIKFLAEKHIFSNAELPYIRLQVARIFAKKTSDSSSKENK